MPYRCAACGTPVLVAPGLVVRRCACKAPIVAEARATLEGRSAVR